MSLRPMNKFKPISHAALAVISVFILSSCTKKMNSTSITIPPGTLVQYSNSEIVQTAKEFYTVELKKMSGANLLTSIEDITPKFDKGVASIQSYILPKDKNESALFIIQASLTRQGIILSSFVIPGRVTKPDFATTLVVELLSKYPNKNVNDFSVEQVTALEKSVQAVIDKKTAVFKFPEESTMFSRLRFLKNAVASDLEFLKICKEFDVNFAFNADGTVTSEPYPFGAKNLYPILDASNSTPLNREVRGVEKDELVIRAQAIDPESDLILYQWYADDKVVSTFPAEHRWTPDYDAARPETYPYYVLITDGGPPQKFSWNVIIENRNRKPELTEKCVREVEEWQTYKCKMSAVDFDNDGLLFRISDQGLDAKIQVNGQETDPTSRKLTISDSNEIEIVYTPNNNDALKRSAYIEVTVEDVNGGLTVLPLNITIRDINLAPGVTGGATQLSMGGGNNEWDRCADQDPDGIGAYWFYIQIDDPDNQTAAAPRNQHPDKVSVNFGGTLKDQVKQINDPDDPTTYVPNASSGCPANTPEHTYFCFEWKPEQSRKSGTLTIQAKDNHGGIAGLQTLNLIAYDRNVRPCMGAASGLTSQLLYDSAPSGQVAFSSTDDDLVSPFIVAKNLPLKLVPFLKDCTIGSNPLILRRTAHEADELLYRISPQTTDGATSGCLASTLYSQYSGMIEFSRPTTHSTAVTIPLGYTIESPIASGMRLKYKTSVAATFRPEDLKIAVPIEAIDRVASIGSLNRFVAAPPAAGMTVTNPTALTAGGNVTFTRPTNVAPLTIPAGTVISTTESSGPTVSTIRYQTMAPATMAIGDFSISTAVSRVKIAVAPNLISTMTGGALAGPAISITNPVEVQDFTNYSLFTLNGYGVTSNADRFCYNYYAEDGTTTPAGEVTQFVGALPEPGLQFTNPSAMGLYGQINISRTNTAAAVTIPSGSIVKNAIGSRYKLTFPVTLAIGVSSATASVTREGHYNLVRTPGADDTACIGFSDTNYAALNRYSTNMTANEGSATLGFLMEVTDNPSDPSSPNDPADRHEFIPTPIGAAPAGTIRFCRDPGDNPADLNSPACVPCTNLSGDYFRASRCYVRFMPAYADISLTYLYQMRINDNGMTFPAGKNQLNTTLSITVKEINDPPVLTDENYNPIAGNTLLNPVVMGSFVENTQSDYFFYATDPDRTENLKRLGFVIDQVTDLKTGTVVATPSGMTLGLVGYNGDPLGTGWGSRTQARLTWKPNDGDAKRLAGTDGFVVRIRIYDSTIDSSTRLNTYAYFKMYVSNINNTPSIRAFGTAGNTLTIEADTYYKHTSIFNLIDADYGTVGAPVNHVTKLSLCKLPGIYNCAAPRNGWPIEIDGFDAVYSGNSGVSQCRSGGNPLASVALPLLTLMNPTTPVFENPPPLYRYTYQMEWCPQKRHIGKHQAFLFVNDNEDKDRNGVTIPLQTSVAPLVLNVVAPVYFESPGRDSGGNVVHYMRQAFAGAAPYQYYTIVKNSRMSPGGLTYSLLTAPTGMTINPSGLISWVPTVAQITGPNPATWPVVQVRVRDNTTGEMDTASFKVEVKNPLSPTNFPPAISSSDPVGATVTVKERVAQTFQVVATDPNSNPLHYRWYVNNVLKYDLGPSFEYRPTMDDGFTVGVAGLKPGQHVVKVEVTDGTGMVSRTWSVNVLNTIPSPSLSYTLTGVTNLTWNTEVGVPTNSGPDTWNSVVFGASYVRAGALRNSVYNVKLEMAL